MRRPQELPAERPQDKTRTHAGQSSGPAHFRRALKVVKEVTGEGRGFLGLLVQMIQVKLI